MKKMDKNLIKSIENAFKKSSNFRNFIRRAAIQECFKENAPLSSLPSFVLDKVTIEDIVSIASEPPDTDTRKLPNQTLSLESNGQRLRTLRMAAGLSQAKVATAAGLDQSMISYIERNNCKIKQSRLKALRHQFPTL